MTVEENARFLEEMRASPSKYCKMLSAINSSKDEDRDTISEAIRREVGFTEMDSRLLRVLEEWMERELRKQIEAERGSGDELTQTQTQRQQTQIQGLVCVDRRSDAFIRKQRVDDSNSSTTTCPSFPVWTEC